MWSKGRSTLSRRARRWPSKPLAKRGSNRSPTTSATHHEARRARRWRCICSRSSRPTAARQPRRLLRCLPRPSPRWRRKPWPSSSRTRSMAVASTRARPTASPGRTCATSMPIRAPSTNSLPRATPCSARATPRPWMPTLPRCRTDCCATARPTTRSSTSTLRPTSRPAGPKRCNAASSTPACKPPTPGSATRAIRSASPWPASSRPWAMWLRSRRRWRAMSSTSPSRTT